jgi:aminopeptidase N
MKLTTALKKLHFVRVSTRDLLFGDKAFQSPLTIPSSASDLVKLNKGQTGYYRVKYSENLRTQLVEQLNTDHTVFEELDRTGLIDDSFNLAIAGEIKYSEDMGF